MNVYKFRLVCFFGVVFFLNYTLHSFVHHDEHLSESHEEAECAYCDTTNVASINSQINNFIIYGNEGINQSHSENKSYSLLIFYNPRAPPKI